eukprot:g17721.t1
MSNGDEVWQVAGRRRHRRPGGSESDKQQRQQSELRRTNHRHGSSRNNSSSRSSSSSSSSDFHGRRRKSKGKAIQGDYSYKTVGTRQPLPGQGADGSREEVARRELAKLLKLKALLKGTALWERLVEGLRSTLSQLGLAASFGDEKIAAVACPAGAAGREVDSPSARPDTLRELVCYGIGNFTESDSSRYQLALALCLRDLLSAPSSSASDVASGGAPSAAASDAPGAGSPAPGPALLAFDPVMGETEAAMLESLGCGLLQNEEGKRSCCRREKEAGGGRGGDGGGGGDGEGDEGDEVGEVLTTPTLFFMPHCPQRLYSNVLWANWSARGLGSIVILGNKLSSYGDRLLDARARSDPTNAILRAGPLLQDIDLLPYPASFRARWRRDVDALPGLERAFNDLALSFSAPGARGSAEGVEALRNRPLEFVEAEDGELVTGRAAPA